MSSIPALWTGIPRDTPSNIKILFAIIDRVCLGFPQCEMVYISLLNKIQDRMDIMMTYLRGDPADNFLLYGSVSKEGLTLDLLFLP